MEMATEYPVTLCDIGSRSDIRGIGNRYAQFVADQDDRHQCKFPGYSRGDQTDRVGINGLLPEPHIGNVQLMGKRPIDILLLDDAEPHQRLSESETGSQLRLKGRGNILFGNYS